VRLEALINGGGQERGIRSGTLPAPLAVGLGAAARIARQELDSDHRWGGQHATDAEESWMTAVSHRFEITTVEDLANALHRAASHGRKAYEPPAWIIQPSIVLRKPNAMRMHIRPSRHSDCCAGTWRGWLPGCGTASCRGWTAW